MNDLYYKSSKDGGKCWHINSVAEALGESICHVLPVVHALCGCDSTSRLYGIGKGAALRKAREENSFLKCIEAFCCQSGTKDAISSAGEKALVYLYGGKGNDTLDGLRKTKFCNKVAKSSTTVEVHSLPPTTDAAKYHSFRVYCQVQEWMGNSVDPRNGAGVCGRDSLNRRRWIHQWLLIHYWNWSDVSVRATVTLNAVVANGMSLNVPVHVVNVKDSVKIATLMQAPMIQVNTNSYHE